MKTMVNLMLFIFLMTVKLTSHSESTQFIKHPDAVNRGIVTPIELFFSPPLVDGDNVMIYNDNKLIGKLSVSGSLRVSTFGLRYKAVSDQTQINLLRNNKELEGSNIRFSLQEKATLIQHEQTNGQPICLTKVKPDSMFMILCKSATSTEDYIEKIDLVNNEGLLSIQITPYVSQNPFFMVKGNFNPNEMLVKPYNSIEISGTNSKSIDVIVNGSSDLVHGNNNWIKSN